MASNKADVVRSTVPPIFAFAPARIVQVHDCAIVYRLWNEAEPQAPGLLFLHGFGAHQH